MAKGELISFNLRGTAPRITVLQAAGTTTDFDSRSVGVRRCSTLELESLVAQPGHPQRTNCSSRGPNP
ncbi:hypothetical protein CRG98_004422 [Punica granatum]|uniref:Uncharacterized protein n=1 Tax=Punica granatum TaxID=22663 RepID=A0A2I0L3B9_PUNGR|nr:hypothetical protein CRG98_004422 [Punica granatum]